MARAQSGRALIVIPPFPADLLISYPGMRTTTTAGDVNTQAGMAAHVYLVTQSMERDTPKMNRASFNDLEAILPLEPAIT